MLAGGLVVASLPIQAGQGSQVGQGEQVKLSGAYKTPRTPWGDPDFQGNYTNLYEAGTPLERPDQFAGRKLEEVTGAELAAAEERRSRTARFSEFETPFDAPIQLVAGRVSARRRQPGVARSSIRRTERFRR